MSRVLAAALCACVAGGCAQPGLDADAFLDELREQGVAVADRNEVRAAIQQEFDNINEAMATGVPIPKLARRVTLNGIHADVFWCPGKAAQAQAVVAWHFRGARPGDPQFLAQAAEVLSGTVHLPAGELVVSLAPTPEQDQQLLDVAIASARVFR
jgi:hypothetical protein